MNKWILLALFNLLMLAFMMTVITNNSFGSFYATDVQAVNICNCDSNYCDSNPLNCNPDNWFCDPIKAEGNPDECSPTPCSYIGNFISLGTVKECDCYILATMEKWFLNGTGTDIRIYEVGYVQGGADESFDVFISADKANWIKVAGPISNDQGEPYASIDIVGNSGQYKYIKVTPSSTAGGDGPDIDAIEAEYEAVNYNSVSKLPDTGQTKCYDNNQEIPCPNPGEPFYGQDAQYITNPQSYTKLDANGNDLPDDAPWPWVMVRDNVTGLIWEVKTDDGSIHDKDDTYTWDNAQDVFIATLNSQNYGGSSVWRLPTVYELMSIVNRNTLDTKINTSYFPNTVPFWYWSSTRTWPMTKTWVVAFFNGDVLPNEYEYLNVRAVRGVQTSNNFVDNGDGTISDLNSGLMWQKGTAPGAYTWPDALSYCENLTLAGYNDWRVPNINELQSLADYTRSYPSINISYFPDTGYAGAYWSSTTFANSPFLGLFVRFDDGYVYGFNKGLINDLVVRAVRNIDQDTGFCKGNYDYDKDVDGGDAFVFKKHFGRSTFKNPCPSDGPAPVEKTGQTISHAIYDDGYYKSGVATPLPKPRFSDNGNGTVTDNLTGLIWLKNANCFGQKTWNQALTDANGLNNGECGLTDGSVTGDWRIPNRKELESVLDFGRYNPALPSGHPFVNVQTSSVQPIYYWSSTTDADHIDIAWSVDMGYSDVSWDPKASLFFVWPVRGGH